MLRDFIKNANFGISLIVFAMAIGIAVITLPIFGNYALIVKSGSMQPTIGVGDLIAVKNIQGLVSPQNIPVRKYSEGDVVAFKDAKNPKIITTHRIVSSQIKDGKIYYQTKGDANNIKDTSLVAEENVLGRADYSIKGIGKIFAFAKTKAGLMTMIIFPALMVIFIEVVTLIKEFKKKESKAPSITISTSAVIKTAVPVFAAALMFSTTFAFFTDSGQSTDNVFTAAESFCNSTEGHVVINEVFYNVDSVHNGQGAASDWEWVELYNPTSSPVSLTGWSIADGNASDAFPGTPEIPPCGFLIVSPSTEAELEDQTNDGGNWTIPDTTVFITLSSAIGNGFATGGDSVILKNGSATEIDSMSFGTDTGELNPSVPVVVSGHSLEREPDGFDTDSAGDFVDRTTPTPGS